MKAIIVAVLSLAIIALPLHAQSAPEPVEDPQPVLWIPFVLVAAAVIVVTSSGCSGAAAEQEGPPARLRCGRSPEYTERDLIGCGFLIPQGAHECPRCFLPVPPPLPQEEPDGMNGMMESQSTGNEWADGMYSFTNYTSSIEYSTNGVDWQSVQIPNLRTNDPFAPIYFYDGGVQLVILPAGQTFADWVAQQGDKIIATFPIYEGHNETALFRYAEHDQ